jgi:hypothetical protein
MISHSSDRPISPLRAAHDRGHEARFWGRWGPGLGVGRFAVDSPLEEAVMSELVSAGEIPC